ncbi:MAG: response regulator [Opitutales bacterium]
MTPIQVTIIEDNAVFRESISMIIEGSDAYTLIKAYSNAEYAIHDLRDEVIAPDVILLDLRLPGMTGSVALPKIKALNKDHKVIILTQSNAEKDLLSCMHQGAAGYLLKSASPEEILEAIKYVHTGGVIIDPKVAQYILDFMSTIPQATEAENVLSPRETEVLRLLAEGYLKKEISDKLDIAFSTVDYHVKHIYGKLDVKNAPAAVAQAYRKGFL